MLSRLLLTLRHSYHLWRVLSAPRNRRKGHWRENSQQRLLFLAYQEMSELAEAVHAHQQGTGCAAHVASEAADVSAFVAMLADNARRGK